MEWTCLQATAREKKLGRNNKHARQKSMMYVYNATAVNLLGTRAGNGSHFVIHDPPDLSVN